MNDVNFDKFYTLEEFEAMILNKNSRKNLYNQMIKQNRFIRLNFLTYSDNVICVAHIYRKTINRFFNFSILKYFFHHSYWILCCDVCVYSNDYVYLRVLNKDYVICNIDNRSGNHTSDDFLTISIKLRLFNPGSKLPLKFIPPTHITYTVSRVIDGDTIEVLFELNNNKYVTKIRLAGIDAPELHGKTGLEQMYALKSKNFLSEMIENKTVKLINISHDKYGGRFVADVLYILNGVKINVSKHMISNKMAIEYNGGKKEPFDSKNYK